MLIYIFVEAQGQCEVSSIHLTAFETGSLSLFQQGWLTPRTRFADPIPMPVLYAVLGI